MAKCPSDQPSHIIYSLAVPSVLEIRSNKNDQSFYGDGSGGGGDGHLSFSDLV